MPKRWPSRTERIVPGPETDPSFAGLKAQIIARTGHHYYVDKDGLLYDRVAKRLRALTLPDTAAYAQLLTGADGEAEWAALEAEITIGETFFFRYAEQFTALKQTILPNIIARRTDEHRLRIWSAGCSTGAEAYSVAILVDELLGSSRRDWDVTILGTDISAAALATARAGEYGRWALRTMPQEDRNRWFRAIPPAPGPMREGGYRLRPEYRAMARFERQNLVDIVEGKGAESCYGFDLILCRNVLIYFRTDAVNGMVRAFADRLVPDGWLLLGHAEPNPAFAAWLTPVQLPGTVVYRREGEVRPVSSPTANAIVAVEEAVVPVSLPQPVNSPPSPEPAEAASAVSGLESVERVRVLADTGDAAAAWRLAAQELDIDPCNAGLLFLKGVIAIDLGRDAEAERALRGALYLEPDFGMALYHLGLILLRQDRRSAARRAFRNAERIAGAMPPDAILPNGDGVTAGELVGTIRLMLDRSS